MTQTMLHSPLAPAPDVCFVDAEFLRSLGLPDQLPGTRFVFPDRARRAFRSPSQVRPSEWAERHFLVVEGSRPGPWRNENAPYIPGIVNAWTRFHVREIIYVAPPQVGKSKSAEILAAYTVDQDPGPFQYIVPDESAAKAVVRDRFKPLFKRSPRLAGYLTGREDDLSIDAFVLKNMNLYFDWAGSATRLASKAVRFQVYEEWDKHPHLPSKKEASSKKLAAKRQRTFRDRKSLKISTPTVEKGPIWQAYISASARYQFHAKCPKCGFMQQMHLTGPDGAPRLRWPDDVRDPDQIEDGLLAWYECAHCAAPWDDHLRDKAVLAGEWREELTGMPLEAHMDTTRPRRVGFHMSTLYSSFVSLSEIAAEFLRSSGDKIALRDFMNGHLAEPWRDYTQERPEARILALRDDRPRGLVPGGGRVAAMVAGVDTQKDHFYYEIRAFGWGLSEEGWLVREGIAETFEALDQILWEDTYADAAGGRYLVQLTNIDAMGTRTKEVYDWAIKNRGRVYPCQGVERMQTPTSITNLETYPNSTKPIPGGLKLLRVNTTYFKNALSNKLDINPADPGAWHLHSEVGDEYARQMTAEYLDESVDAWRCPEKRANHYWDCSVLTLVAANKLGVRYWTRPEAAPAKPQASAGAVKPAEINRSLPSWR